MTLAESHKASEKNSAGARTLFGNVTNNSCRKTANTSQDTPRGSHFCRKTNCVTAAAAPSMAAPPRKNGSVSSLEESSTNVDRQSPRELGGGGAGAEERHVGCADPVTLLEEQEEVSPRKKMQRPRKFLEKYFFLKNLNALPLTPEREKNVAASAPFRRVSVEEPATDVSGLGAPPPPPPPPPPSDNNGDHSTASLVRSRRFDAPRPSVLFYVDILPNKQPQERDGSDNGRMSPAKVTVSRRSSITLQKHEVVPPTLVIRWLSQEADPPRPEREVDDGNVAEDLTARNNPAKDVKSVSRGRSALEETSSYTDGIDLSAISAIHEEEVLIDFDGSTTSTRLPFSTLDQVKDILLKESRIQEEGACAVLSTPKDVAEGFTQQPTHMPETDGGITEDNINHWILSFAGRPCGNADTLWHAIDEFLSLYFMDQFKAHEAEVLEAAFVVGYTQMVALPMTRMLESSDRRILCMKRDIYIRRMIEFFMLTLPVRRGKKLFGRIRSASCQQTRQSLLAPRSVSQSTHQLGCRFSARGVRSLPGVMQRDARVSGRGGKAYSEAAEANFKAFSQAPSRPIRLRAYRIVPPVPRKITPKRSPRDDELMDIMKLDLS
ncbi:hypothetical protein TcBrA4_0009080 [Trypanosoma cruzi]|nr:hypothetical protein TcBrA4_0009080 [Trypanosoma cruzi]